MDHSNADGDVTVVFRFRDLVAKTILEHDAIVRSGAKCCWWGWWKRPTEERVAAEDRQRRSDVHAGVA